LRDDSSTMPTDTGVCPHCGQSLPDARPVLAYGARGPSKTAVAVTIVVHALLLLLVLLSTNMRPAGKKLAETFVTFAPTPTVKPKARAEAPPKPSPKRAHTSKPVVVMPRLPNTITVPFEPPREEEVAKEPAKPTEVPPEMDMQAYIEAQRRKRGVVDAPAAESENDKALRNIKANIGRANAAAQGDDGSGGVFEVKDQTFHSAVVKFRGWNPNFKRRWLSQVTVELGSEPDIETAIVNKMIEIIRKEKTGDFAWESHRLNRVVTLSARPQDTAALQAFLFKEMFPHYIAPARH
jgi:hypothetical protein